MIQPIQFVLGVFVNVDSPSHVEISVTGSLAFNAVSIHTSVWINGFVSNLSYLGSDFLELVLDVNFFSASHSYWHLDLLG